MVTPYCVNATCATHYGGPQDWGCTLLGPPAMTVTPDLLYVMLEDMRQELNAVRKDLARIQPLVEYAEQLIQQRDRISKWIPGKR